MNSEQESEQLDRPAKEVWALDCKIGSVLQGDCFQAERATDKDDVVLWLSREPLSEEQVGQCIEHVERLCSVRDWGEIECGVDSEKRAFVVLPHGSTKRIDFDEPGAVVLRNRFITCLILISQLHERGIGCGNITTGSFAVDSLGAIYFIGFLGGYGEKLASTVPLDIRVFSRSGDGLVGAPSVAADVYSLAVMGLELFGAQFPLASIDVRQMEQYLENVRPDAPPWVLSVLATIVREPNRVLCRDVQELIRALSMIDVEYLKTLDVKRAGATAKSEQELPRSIEQIRESLLSPEESRKRRIAELFRSKYVKWSGISVLAAGVICLVVSQADILGIMMPAHMARKRAGDGQGTTVTDVSRALAVLRTASSTRMGGVERTSSSATTTGVAGDVGQAGTSAQSDVEATITRKLTIQPDNIVLTSLSNGASTAEERESILALYEEFDDESKVRLAQAFEKAEPDAVRMFREFLEKKVQRSLSFSSGRPMPQPLSIDALFLAAEFRLSPEAARVWGRGAMLSNEEVEWLVQAHARKRSAAVPYLAGLVLDRQLVQWPRTVFFEAMAQSDGNSGAPYEALLRSAEVGVSASDANLFLKWDDSLSTKVLYAVLVLSSDVEILQNVMSGLMSKPTSVETPLPILEACLQDGGSAVVKFAKIVGVLGLSDANSERILKAELESVRGDSKQEIMVEALLEKGTAGAVEIVLAVYGTQIHPETLLPLLSRPEPRVRKAVIPFLKEVRISSSRALIQERYLTEQDPEVRRVYETELFSTL